MNVVDLGNGVRGIRYTPSTVQDVIKFIKDSRGGNDPYDVIQYHPKHNLHTFGSSRTLLTEGMYIIYKERSDSFFLTKDESWVSRYSSI